jgi:hypothetical protein
MRHAVKGSNTTKGYGEDEASGANGPAEASFCAWDTFSRADDPPEDVRKPRSGPFEGPVKARFGG